MSKPLVQNQCSFIYVLYCIEIVFDSVYLFFILVIMKDIPIPLVKQCFSDNENIKKFLINKFHCRYTYLYLSVYISVSVSS